MADENRVYEVFLNDWCVAVWGFLRVLTLIWSALE